MIVFKYFILDNAHISTTDTKTGLFGKSPEEQAKLLHVGDASRYNSDSDIDFNLSDIEGLKAAEKTNIRIFETDKLEELAEKGKALDEKPAEK